MRPADQLECSVALVDAAIAWREPWHRAWKRVLEGEVRAQKRGGRWFLAQDDVQAIATVNAADRHAGSSAADAA